MTKKEKTLSRIKVNFCSFFHQDETPEDRIKQHLPLTNVSCGSPHDGSASGRVTAFCPNLLGLNPGLNLWPLCFSNVVLILSLLLFS